MYLEPGLWKQPFISDQLTNAMCYWYMLLAWVGWPNELWCQIPSLLLVQNPT